MLDNERRPRIKPANILLINIFEQKIKGKKSDICGEENA